jgi:hypothetical protein
VKLPVANCVFPFSSTTFVSVLFVLIQELRKVISAEKGIIYADARIARAERVLSIPESNVNKYLKEIH